MRFIKIAVVWSLLFFFLSSLPQSAAAAGISPCSRERAQAAEADAGQLKNWAAVYASFKRYANCDDGAIAEGYSDSVAKSLANHWSDFQDLNRLVARSYMFKKFVLRHVDENDVPRGRVPNPAKRPSTLSQEWPVALHFDPPTTPQDTLTLNRT